MFVDGRIGAEAGLAILTGEVHGLAATNADRSALGLDEATAKALVTAKLYMAATAVRVQQEQFLVPLAIGPTDAIAAYNAPHLAIIKPAADLQNALETSHKDDIIGGLGVVMGLLKGSEADPDAQAQAQLTTKILN